jgi:hypothetical protein
VGIARASRDELRFFEALEKVGEMACLLAYAQDRELKMHVIDGRFNEYIHCSTHFRGPQNRHPRRICPDLVLCLVYRRLSGFASPSSEPRASRS